MGVAPKVLVSNDREVSSGFDLLLLIDEKGRFHGDLDCMDCGRYFHCLLGVLVWPSYTAKSNNSISFIL